ncbi:MULTISPECIES: autoinducer binding domain-containing protein [Sphingomonadales]|jgi:LuxR family quorum-sensing system transcriptional regulator CciR|uniref:LuxR family quorum-sensing system transcriptional regulator CciR n=6 Tax=Sphingomonadales TaxID=204457 RepID=A0A7W6BST2_9SPHN|nr:MULTISPECIES: autoinducer binding domain-containing protein [Sphingomonadales]EZP71286.1 putative LuxR family transcriptional regulator [Sphingomonas paucimobilis]BAV63495.1 autoinducer-binding domain-containing protein [Sphingobium cloacae]AMK24792.1 autoinducer-binding domain-containing protein [Sphingobium sp. TKS]ATE66096.1 LuxR family transcriptional regulator [Rhizorhabdus dicambivorans]AZI37559.1 LuxR family transcriptional regulator [Caenibius tardaugens NBRC 16725]
MYVNARMRETLSRFNAASSMEALLAALADAATKMGFPYVAMIQHGGLPRLVERALVITNYPAEFVRFYTESHAYVIDPVYEVSQLLDRPFSWDEIPGYVDLTGTQSALFEEARLHGLVHGVTVPLHIPSESHASCTFARAEPIMASPSLLTTLHIVAAFGFKAGLRLHHASRGHDVPRLTRREAQCTALVAVGKSDWEISQILGLSETSVRYFVSHAKQRYGVYKRSELVARALIDAQILRNDQGIIEAGPRRPRHRAKRRSP